MDFCAASGLSCGRDAALNSVVEQLTGLLGLDGAKMLQTLGHAFRLGRAPGHSVRRL
jgi:hypothetical protein